ncbi:hypothetical protein ACFP1Z_00385 [Streptomyces gamaensis]|uniref:Uncharacterized protein n=1 Tax=Streptomyces gamaensis TaxID=1763542 RepID=A0ABW0YT51_9ACTN
MAGFRALAREVRDPRHSIALRRTSLRKCLERFAPYGHRATWHHLCVRTGLDPVDRSPDPARLIAALTELEEARAVWLAYERSVADRRKREKHDGIRQPGALDDWHRNTWGGCAIVPSVSPTAHPRLPLAEVLRRVIAAVESGPGELCPVCARDRLEWRCGLECCRGEGPVCAECGIVVPLPALSAAALATARRRMFADRYAAV